MSRRFAAKKAADTAPITMRERSQLARRSVPIALAMLASFMLWVEDILMMAKSGPAELAGVAVGSAALGALLFFGRGIVAGFSVLTNMAVGRTDRRETISWYRHGLWIATFFAVVTMAAAIAISFLLRFTPISAHTVEVAAGYVRARTPGILPLLLLMCPYAYLIAVDRSWGVFAILLAANLWNVALNYVLIYGKLGLPQLGATGCGLSTSLTSSISALLLLLRASRHLKVRFGALLKRPSRSLLKRGWSIGWPRGLQQLSERLLFVVMPLWVALWGDLQQVSYQLALSVSTVCHCLALGIAGAVEVTVSIEVGGGRAPRAKRAAFAGVSMVAVVAGVIAMVVLCLRESLILLLGSGEEAVLPYALPAFMMLALNLVLGSVATVAGAAIRGAGMTKASFVASAVPQWFVTMPAVYLVSEVLDLSVSGVFIAFSMGALVSSLMFLALVTSRRFGRPI